MKIGVPKLFGEGQRKKSAEELLREANDFVQSGEYSAAISRFREAVSLKKKPLSYPDSAFRVLWDSIRVHQLQNVFPGDPEYINREEFPVEVRLAVRNSKNFMDVAGQFGLDNISSMSPEQIANMVSPASLHALEEALRPAPAPKKNV